MSKGKFSFKGKVVANAKKNTREAGSTKYLVLPDGITSLQFDDTQRKVTMDFLPYIVTDKNHPDRDDKEEVALDGEQWWKRPFKLHRIGRKAWVCRKSIGAKCPICEYQEGLWDTDREGAIDLYPQDRELYIPIPLDSKKHEAEPKYVWDMSYKMFYKEFKDELDENEDLGRHPSLDEGLTLELSLKWKKISEKSKPFPEVTHIEYEDREPYDEAILDEVPNLDDIIKASVLSYEDLKNSFFEIDEEEDGGKMKDDDEKESKDRGRNRYQKPAGKQAEKEPERTSSRTNTKTKREPEPEPQTDDQLPTWDDMLEMSERRIKKLIDEYGLQTDPEQFGEDELEDLRKSVAEELGIEIPKKRSERTERRSERQPRQEENSRTQSRSSSRQRTTPDTEDNEDIEIPKAERCVACQGSGKDSRGRTCPICKGTGKKPKEEKEEERPSRSARREQSTGKAGNRCPHGHVFGKDTEEFDECNTCKIWDDCIEEKEKK